MSILDKIRRKKEKIRPSKEENVLDMVKEAPKEDKQQPQPLKENTAAAYRILKSAHLSEKTNSFGKLGRYVFKVDRRANKIEVRKAVEATYDVHVVGVNVVNVKGKLRRTGRKSGKTEDWKKAIVTLKTGEKIAGLTEVV